MDTIADLPPHAIRHSERYIFADTLDIDHGKSNILPKYSKINCFFPHLYSLSQYWHVLTNLHPVNHHLPWGRLATASKFIKTPHQATSTYHSPVSLACLANLPTPVPAIDPLEDLCQLMSSHFSVILLCRGFQQNGWDGQLDIKE